MPEQSKRNVAGVFHEIVAFERVLDTLLEEGFDASEVSILGSHEAILKHFGRLPDISELTDARDTPREALRNEAALHKAIDYIANTLALISEVGVAAAAYAVGGPVGVAAISADVTDTTIDSVLSGYIDDKYRDRFEQNIRDGGVICWVRTPENDDVAAATRIMTAAGGQHIHEIEI